jgi:uncharacterized membrane protein
VAWSGGTRIAALAAGAVLAAASPAAAPPLSAHAEAVLGRGKPWVEVTADADGKAGVIAAVIDIPAPAEAIWKAVNDCTMAPSMVTSLKSCRVLEADPAGRWDVREEISKPTLLPSVRNVFRSDYDPPREIRFHRVDGDLSLYEGTLRLEPRGGAVRVLYDAKVVVPFRIPPALGRLVLRYEVPQALISLRRAAMAQALP